MISILLGGLFIICLCLVYCLRFRLIIAFKVGLGAALIGCLTLGWLMFGPRTYMMYLPKPLQMVFHPWILGSIVFLTFLFAALFLPMVLICRSWSISRSADMAERRSDASKSKSSQRDTRWLALAATIGIGLLYFVCIQSLFNPKNTNVFYRHISIDPKSLQVKFYDPVPASPIPEGDFYWPFYGGEGCDVNHYNVTDSDQARIRYNALELTNSGTLETRTKDQLLWQSEWGSVYTESFYDYRPNNSDNKIAFRVYVDSNSLESDRPTIDQASIPTASNLIAISLIRVFKTLHGNLFVIASYLPNGHLSRITKAETRDGDWYPKTELPPVYFDNGSAIKEFGVLASFPLKDYSLNKLDPVAPGTSGTEKSLSDCVNFHYDQNFLVAQDIFQGGKRRSRVMEYKKTYEDFSVPSDGHRSFMLN